MTNDILIRMIREKICSVDSACHNSTNIEVRSEQVHRRVHTGRWVRSWDPVTYIAKEDS